MLESIKTEAREAINDELGGVRLIVNDRGLGSTWDAAVERIVARIESAATDGAV